MEKKSIEKLWEIIELALGDDFVHGMPHIKNVHKNFELFKKDYSKEEIDEKFINLLEYAVILHDIGRPLGFKNHGFAGVKFLMTFFSEDLSSIKKEDLIYVYHAIEHHCKGLKEEKKTAKTNKDKCLGLLVLFDHIDAIGKRGILRAIKSKSSEIPFLPKENENISRIKKLLEAYNKDEEIDEMKYKEMKESSIIEHLTYNLCVTFNIQNKVEYLLRSKIKKEIQKRLKFMEEYIRINLELLD